MSCLQCYSGIHRRLRWERFWPRLLIILVAIMEILLTIAVLCLEFWSMIINIKYSFFFIGFIASFVHITTWILTFNVGCCCRTSLSCTTITCIVHLLSIAISSIMVFYNVSFLRNPHMCLWSKNQCNGELKDMHLFGFTMNTSDDIHWIKLTLLKIQIGCAAAMIVTCMVYVLSYVYTVIRVYSKNKVADVNVVGELAQTRSTSPSPRPNWPNPPRESSSESDF
ncbi:unnamed protein product [Adineta ricciae]|uniref:Uncharacterized protein n=1 Tax=Adineta ricciae TaxID=249248 RepID=A0A816FEX1_ADIRI|nr:unnamed protein product [Adineta ricciae]CAF1660702.1 unnamed protein product [Adineta ricciae]